jgi:hypothetical protein
MSMAVQKGLSFLWFCFEQTNHRGTEMDSQCFHFLGNDKPACRRAVEYRVVIPAKTRVAGREPESRNL